ncbi:MAG TPA: superoxide dismutase [Chitinophagaceae bacterium]|nr:superoxide dismutase [Chitinophagaceae bacterium]
MKIDNSRRQFILHSTKTVLAVAAGVTATGSLLQSCSGPKKASGSSGLKTGFSQEPLSYSYSSLDKSIDGTTMEIHYTKHAAGYATNLQDAAKNEGVDMSKPLEEVLNNISKFSTKMRNNGGGHYNHELFWKSLSPSGVGKPAGVLLTAIESGFNSFESFKAQFSDAGKNRFGSGWAWLYLDADKKLRIGSTPNQDNPLMDVSDIKGLPVLGLDVWEHAYYLRYQNKRADYINAWWDVVNWGYIQNRYESLL